MNESLHKLRQFGDLARRILAKPTLPGQLPKTRVYTPVPVVLRMKGEGTAEDGGGSDGAALAEARIVVNGQVR